MSQPCDIIAYDRNGHELMEGDVVRVHPGDWIGSLVSAIDGRCQVLPATSQGGSEVAGGVAVECGAAELVFVSR